MNTNGQKSRHFPLLREIYYACAYYRKCESPLDNPTATKWSEIISKGAYLYFMPLHFYKKSAVWFLYKLLYKNQTQMHEIKNDTSIIIVFHLTADSL